MGHDFVVEFVRQHDHVLETLAATGVKGLAFVPDLGLLEEVEPTAVNDTSPAAERVGTRKIVAPKIRSKAATSLRYSLPPLAIPNVSSICAADLKRIVWLCWRTANVGLSADLPFETATKVCNDSSSEVPVGDGR